MGIIFLLELVWGFTVFYHKIGIKKAPLILFVFMLCAKLKLQLGFAPHQLL